MTLKLTPTFADKVAAAVNGGAPHIVQAHEPLTGEVFMPYTGKAELQLEGTPVPPRTGAEIVAAETPAIEPVPLKIALVGTAPSSRMLAPYGDTSWKIWGCSPGNMKVLPRYDAWFEVHSNLLWPEHAAYGPQYLDWLKTLTCPVYMQDKTQVPNATPFDWYGLVQEFGPDFFTSSFTWMMAYAMRQGANEIALYGIDMASRDEYILQRPGFYFFRHEARKRGIKISAPHESDIMQSPPLYAIADSTPLGRKIIAREKEIRDRIAPITAQRDGAAQQVVYLQGAAEDVDYFKSIWAGVATQLLMLEEENARLKAQIAATTICSP